MKKPVIGITSSTIQYSNHDSVMLPLSYCQSILKAGGFPVVIPNLSKETVTHWIGLCDGFLFSGGEDLDPQSYQEEPHPKLEKILPERDQFEISLIQYARNKRLPILAICRGIHVLNVALGGTIIQDIESALSNCLQHVQKASKSTPIHSIRLEEGSFVHSALGSREVRVNSFHHQAIGKVAPPLKVTARASDGVIEAVEGINSEDSFVIGVQWHPEDMENTFYMDRIFTEFINACQR